jgi:hypothetical protein
MTPDVRPLHVARGHLFAEIEGGLFLLDTGAPLSFGTRSSLVLDGHTFALAGEFMGLSAGDITRFVGVPTAGLIGVDVLNALDTLLDAPAGTVTFSTGELPCEGGSVPLELLLGLPIVSATIAGSAYELVFDTGAQISYLESDALATFPPAGRFRDFHPFYGGFDTETYDVEGRLGGAGFCTRCGCLPEALAGPVRLAGLDGILGNDLALDRRLGYFPRRTALVV